MPPALCEAQHGISRHPETISPTMMPISHREKLRSTEVRSQLRRGRMCIKTPEPPSSARASPPEGSPPLKGHQQKGALCTVPQGNCFQVGRTLGRGFPDEIQDTQKEWGGVLLGSRGNSTQPLGIDHDGRAYEKKNVGICMTGSLCWAAEMDSTL